MLQQFRQEWESLRRINPIFLIIGQDFLWGIFGVYLRKSISYISKAATYRSLMKLKEPEKNNWYYWDEEEDEDSEAESEAESGVWILEDDDDEVDLEEEEECEEEELDEEEEWIEEEWYEQSEEEGEEEREE